MALSTLRRHAAAVLTAGVALATTSSALAADENWILDDLAKAKQVAAEQGKDLLIDFTGSDWCIWCIRLDQEVFAQSEFKAEAPKNFVLVKLDFPNQKEQSEAVKKANGEAQEKYRIEGFPTVILADAKGEAWARTGYRPDGAGPYLEHLSQLRAGRDKRDTLLAQAKEADGLDKARLLDEALGIQDIIVPDRNGVMETIIALDAENEAGLREKYTQQLIDGRIRDALAAAQAKMGGDDFAGAEAALAAIEGLEKASGDVRAEYQMARVSVLYFQQKYEQMNEVIAGLITDEEMPADLRMQLSLARMEYAIQKKDMAMAEKIFDESIAIDPQGQMAMMLGAQKEMIMTQVKQRMEEPVPHDHDGDGVPDHDPADHPG